MFTFFWIKEKRETKSYPAGRFICFIADDEKDSDYAWSSDFHHLPWIKLRLQHLPSHSPSLPLVPSLRSRNSSRSRSRCLELAQLCKRSDKWIQPAHGVVLATYSGNGLNHDDGWLKTNAGWSKTRGCHFWKSMGEPILGCKRASVSMCVSFLWVWWVTMVSPQKSPLIQFKWTFWNILNFGLFDSPSFSMVHEGVQIRWYYCCDSSSYGGWGQLLGGSAKANRSDFQKKNNSGVVYFFPHPPAPGTTFGSGMEWSKGVPK